MKIIPKLILVFLLLSRLEVAADDGKSFKRLTGEYLGSYAEFSVISNCCNSQTFQQDIIPLDNSLSQEKRKNPRFNNFNILKKPLYADALNPVNFKKIATQIQIDLSRSNC